MEGTMKTLKYMLLCAVLCIGWYSSRAQASGYHLIDSLKLGGEGGWDYLTVDTASERLYVSRGMRMQVVDLTTLKLLGEIPNTPGIHGVALVPSLEQGFTSNGRDSSVTVFDLKTLTSQAVIKINGRNPDAIVYDIVSQRVFTFNGGSANATAIDPQTRKPIGTIPLGGKPEFAVTDGQGHLYVNIEDKSTVACIDTRQLTVLKSWSIAPGEEPSGLAIDRKQGRLFSVCRNRLMVISDVNAGKVITTVPIGGGVDGAAFDPALRLAFSSNGEGTLTVVEEEGGGKFAAVENVATRRGARTLALDEKSHKIYTVSAEFGPPPTPSAERPHPRPSLVEGSQTLFVIGR
jgi:DNA-binding beta-propeller fold protein YncE